MNHSWLILIYYPNICLGELISTMTNFGSGYSFVVSIFQALSPRTRSWGGNHVNVTFGVRNQNSDIVE
jgi:hypothetical protein